MEDMATGEIRLSILWEWVHKGAVLTEDDIEVGIKAGHVFEPALFTRLLSEEYNKLLAASSKDVHDASKATTLPISKEITETYVLHDSKMPWFIDLLNINLNITNLEAARKRITLYAETFNKNSVRITDNLDFM